MSCGRFHVFGFCGFVAGVMCGTPGRLCFVSAEDEDEDEDEVATAVSTVGTYPKARASTESTCNTAASGETSRR